LKISVVVQGGGMAGVYSMAALDALANSELAKDVEYIVGSSAGAINASYFVSKRTKEAVDFYINYLSNKNFINLHRFNKIVDIDFMVDTLKLENPLNIELLRTSNIKLDVALTEEKTANPELFTYDGSVDIYELIRATAALPFFYNRFVSIEGELYCDGGIASPLPLNNELIEHSDLVIVILTCDINDRKKKMGRFLKNVFKVFLSKYSDNVVEKLVGENVEYNATMDFLQYKISNSNVFVCFPSNLKDRASIVTSNKEKLEKCSALGHIDMQNVIKEIKKYLLYIQSKERC
jgi:predicted patatin/cPLA2 family phospholipase